MSPRTEPKQGVYLDSCGTHYHATWHRKTGWWLDKCGSPQPPYQRPDFPAACNAQIFIFQTDTI